MPRSIKLKYKKHNQLPAIQSPGREDQHLQEIKKEFELDHRLLKSRVSRIINEDLPTQVS